MLNERELHLTDAYSGVYLVGLMVHILGMHFAIKINSDPLSFSSLIFYSDETCATKTHPRAAAAETAARDK